ATRSLQFLSSSPRTPHSGKGSCTGVETRRGASLPERTAISDPASRPVRLIRFRGPGEGDGERRAFALPALDADVAVHQLDEAFGDGEAQAAALVRPALPGGLLPELAEEVGEGVFGDADAGVAYGEGDLVFRRARLHRDAAAAGELDGVAHQVGRDAAQAGTVEP